MLRFHPLRVTELRPEGQDAVALSLAVPEALRPEYTGLPGQHIVLRRHFNGEEARRTYSLVNTPGEWPLRIVARVHEKGLMSRYLAEEVRVGDELDVLPPNGSLTPRVRPPSPSAEAGGTAAARTYVAFASGCGITPVLAVAKAVLQAHPGDRFILFYGNTSTERTMCLEELLALKDRYLERLAVHFVMSREPQEVELYNGRLGASRVREFARLLFQPEQVAEYFLCGPGDMIDQVGAALRDLNVSPERIHGEHFTIAAPGPGEAAKPALEPAGTATAATAGDEAEVTVRMDGRRRTFTMKMNADTILDAAARAGLELPFSCRAGVCSTCRTKVVRGRVEMAQNYALEDWELEQGYVLACQSRVTTAVLELDYDEK